LICWVKTTLPAAGSQGGYWRKFCFSSFRQTGRGYFGNLFYGRFRAENQPPGFFLRTALQDTEECILYLYCSFWPEKEVLMPKETTKPVLLGPRAQGIFDALLQEIRSGRLAAGGRLPTEQELCERFAGSRNTVRKALERLVVEGLVVRRRGAGCHVAMPDNMSAQLDTVSVMYHGGAEALQQIQNQLLAAGCLLSLFSQRVEGWASELEAVFLQQVRVQRHRALLASCTPLPPGNERLLAELAASGVRIIHIEPYSAAHLPKQNYLMPDYRRGGYAAGNALLIAGYRRLFYVGTASSTAPYTLLQERGFQDGLADQLGQAPERLDAFDHGRNGNFLPSDRLDEIPEQLRTCLCDGKGPIGLFCANLELAARLLTHLEACGLRMPEEFGIISVELAGDAVPSGRTIPRIAFDRSALLKRAVELALQPEGVDVHELVAPSVKGIV
jgi:DNA-binding LacI/PurR family transcriptional regulator